MKTSKTYRLSTDTLARIEDLRLMLSLENDTEAIQKAIKFYHLYAKTFTNKTTGHEIKQLFDMVTED